MHIIETKQNEAGSFDVLVNNVSYRIHRNLTAGKAAERAVEIQTEFRKLREKSRILAAQ